MNEDNLLYIARARDGTWIASSPVGSWREARALIAAHEPDEAKRSNYEIVVETVARVLNDTVPGVRRGFAQRLVKWDGEGPIPDDAHANPHKYQQVAEVLESGDGIPTRVIYRRS